MTTLLLILAVISFSGAAFAGDLSPLVFFLGGVFTIAALSTLFGGRGGGPPYYT